MPQDWLSSQKLIAPEKHILSLAVVGVGSPKSHPACLHPRLCVPECYRNQWLKHLTKDMGGWIKQCFEHLLCVVMSLGLTLGASLESGCPCVTPGKESFAQRRTTRKWCCWDSVPALTGLNYLLWTSTWRPSWAAWVLRGPVTHGPWQPEAILPAVMCCFLCSWHLSLVFHRWVW